MSARPGWDRGVRGISAAVALLPVLTSIAAGAQSVVSAPSSSAGLSIGALAPDFSLPDAAGKSQQLNAFRGKPAAVFFFCGCNACADVARAWAHHQKQDADSAPRTAPKPASAEKGKPVPRTASLSPAKSLRTLVVFSGDADEARGFAARAGLNQRETVLLCDPTLAVTLGTYRVDPCPRVFVVDAAGVIRYTNTGPDDLPQQATGDQIAARAWERLRIAAQVRPVSSSIPTSGGRQKNVPTGEAVVQP